MWPSSRSLSGLCKALCSILSAAKISEDHILMVQESRTEIEVSVEVCPAGRDEGESVPGLPPSFCCWLANPGIPWGVYTLLQYLSLLSHALCSVSDFFWCVLGIEYRALQKLST